MKSILTTDSKIVNGLDKALNKYRTQYNIKNKLPHWPGQIFFNQFFDDDEMFIECMKEYFNEYNHEFIVAPDMDNAYTISNEEVAMIEWRRQKGNLKGFAQKWKASQKEFANE